MRLRDISHYFTLRKTVRNAGQVCAFRNRQRPGMDIEDLVLTVAGEAEEEAEVFFPIAF